MFLKYFVFISTFFAIASEACVNEDINEKYKKCGEEISASMATQTLVYESQFFNASVPNLCSGYYTYESIQGLVGRVTFVPDRCLPVAPLPIMTIPGGSTVSDPDTTGIYLYLAGRGVMGVEFKKAPK